MLIPESNMVNKRSFKLELQVVLEFQWFHMGANRAMNPWPLTQAHVHDSSIVKKSPNTAKSLMTAIKLEWVMKKMGGGLDEVTPLAMNSYLES